MATNRVMIIEGSGQQIIDALIKNMVHKPYTPRFQNVRTLSSHCVFMKGLQPEIRKSQNEFISTMKQTFMGIKYISVEKHFARMYFFTKAQSDEALKRATIVYKALTLTLHPYKESPVKQDRSSLATQSLSEDEEYAEKSEYRDEKKGKSKCRDGCWKKSNGTF